MKTKKTFIAAAIAVIAVLTVMCTCHFVSKTGIINPKEDLSEKKESLDITGLSPFVFEKENGESAFGFSVDDFISGFNSKYRKNHGEEYLLPADSGNWRSFSDLSPRFGSDSVRYIYSEDRSVWLMPTLSVYASSGEVFEVRTTFDHHSFRENLYEKYREINCCLLSMVCVDYDDKEVANLFENLFDSAQNNVFGDSSEYGDENRPPLSAVYKYGNTGIYSFFGSGNVEICIIPLTASATDLLEFEGTEIIDI